MKYIIAAFISTFALLSSCFASDSGKDCDINLLIVTGGHKYDTKEFIKMFEDMGAKCEHIEQPEAAKFLTFEKTKKYDVVVVCDFGQKYEKQKTDDLSNMIKSGRSVLFFHHTIIDYDDWPEWLDIVGIKYVGKEFETNDGRKFKSSNYKYNQKIKLTTVNGNGVVDLPDSEYYDEHFDNLVYKNDYKVLIKGECEGKKFDAAILHRYGKGNVVTFIQGHDKKTFPILSPYIKEIVKYLSSKNSR